MWFTFEQALRKKCELNPDLSLLLSQWEYDRRLVSDALQTVLRYFPHYSRHDASHSNTILVQIARMLGPTRIDALSATDIWLLLEAAYQHDIGMVVTDEQVRSWWGSPGFKDFLAQLQYNPDAELRDAARLFDPNKPPTEFSHDWPIQVNRALSLAIAEYARRQHAPNADRIIRDPERTIGLLSPRTPLIPARLFRLLGRICSHHGRSFEDTLKLPFRESGLGTDDAHPRFVACMLRLGDLLDLDNGRFCPVMVRSFGVLPQSSVAHFEKHAAINHLQVSPTRVEVEAECESYESYEVTDQWLDWLRGELKNQMAHWADIVPSTEFGALPSLGNIQAHIKGYLSLEPGRRPRFEVDRDQILTLVRGANIYTNRLGCMRELLQNAVDATLIRLWNESWSKKRPEELAELTPRDLRRALEDYPIRVEFKRVEEGAHSEKVRWLISVEDNGCGISLEDVRHIQRIGASQKNPGRQRFIREMPEWIRPSGIFGIGLQSVFLFTDKMLVRTRHHATNESLELVLQNGAGVGSDGLSIKRLEGEAARIPVGTRIEFAVDMERMPGALKNASGLSDTSFDPITEQEFPYEVALIDEAVWPFAKTSACPVDFRGKGLKGRKNSSRTVFDDAYFDPETNLEVVFRAHDGFDPGGVRFYYRGVPLNPRNIESYPLLWVACNVHQGRADELLVLSREHFTEEGRRRVRMSLERTIRRFYPQYINGLRVSRQDLTELGFASLCAKILELDVSVVGEEWRGVRIGDEAADMSIGDIVSQERVDYVLDGASSALEFVRSQGPGRMEVSVSFEHGWLAQVLFKSFSHLGFDGRGVTPGEGTSILVFAKRAEDAPITSEGLRLLLRGIRGPFFNRGSFNRATLPCPGQYAILKYARGATKGPFYHHLHEVRSRLVCPFVDEATKGVSVPNLEKLVEWTARNAEGGPRREAEVAEAYWNFIREADTLMAEEWTLKSYDLDAVRRELRRWLD